MQLRQTTKMDAYQKVFEKLSHEVDDLPENFLIGCFIVGLQDEVRLEVKIQHPTTFSDTIRIARLVEGKNLPTEVNPFK